MSCESPSESILLGKNGVLESDDVGKRVFVEKLTGCVYDAAVFVVVPPEAGRIKVFEGEAQRVYAVVAASTVLIFAVGIQPLSKR